MDAETWFTAQEALANGFVDRIHGNTDGDDASDKCKKESKNSAENSEDASAHRARERALALAEAGF